MRSESSIFETEIMGGIAVIYSGKVKDMTKGVSGWGKIVDNIQKIDRLEY